MVVTAREVRPTAMEVLILANRLVGSKMALMGTIQLSRLSGRWETLWWRTRLTWRAFRRFIIFIKQISNTTIFFLTLCIIPTLIFSSSFYFTFYHTCSIISYNKTYQSLFFSSNEIKNNIKSSWELLTFYLNVQIKEKVVFGCNQFMFFGKRNKRR